MDPISVVHQLLVKPGRLAEARELMTKDYSESVAAYGVKLKCALASPVEQPGKPTDLLVVMEYENVDMFWLERAGGMRSGPAVAALWEQIDQLVERRERRVLTATPVSWPPPPLERTAPRLPPSLHRSMLILKPVAVLDVSGRAAWLSAIEAFAKSHADVAVSSAGFHIIQGSSSLPEHLTWDIVTAHPPQVGRLIGCLPSQAVLVHALALGGNVGMFAKAPLASGYKRVVLTAALPGREESVEAAMQVVGGCTGIIKNWSLARIEPTSDPAGWTHAFEMEFESLAELAGPYRSSPYHWAVADAPFHPEASDRAGTGFLNCIYPINRSYLCEL